MPTIPVALNYCFLLSLELKELVMKEYWLAESSSSFIISSLPSFVITLTFAVGNNTYVLIHFNLWLDSKYVANVSMLYDLFMKELIMW